MKSSTKRRRIVRRPAIDSVMSDPWERGRLAHRWAGIACIIMLATGCAGPQLATSPVTPSEEANRAMQSEALPPELRTSGVEQVEMVRRVEQRVRPATRKVCARTLDRETCRGQYRKITMHVKPEDDTINATADIQGKITKNVLTSTRYHDSDSDFLMKTTQICLSAPD